MASSGITHIPQGQGYNFCVDTVIPTIFGIGGFEPENYTKIAKIDYKRSLKLPTAMNTLFSSVFAYINFTNPSNPTNIKDNHKILLFKNATEYKEETPEFKKKRALKSIEKLIKFNLLREDVGAYFFFLDTALQDKLRLNTEYFHMDTPQSISLPASMRQLLNMGEINATIMYGPDGQPIRSKPNEEYPEGLIRTQPIYSDYTILEYENDCVSTTVINPVNEAEIMRFWACNGTIMCINNKAGMHSTPFQFTEDTQLDIWGNSRPPIQQPINYGNYSLGNSTLQTQSTSDHERWIKRTQLVYISLDKIIHFLTSLGQTTLADGSSADSLCEFLDFTDAEFAHLTSMTSFTPINLRDIHASGAQQYRAGKLLKKHKKIKNKKTRKQKLKNKKTRK